MTTFTTITSASLAVDKRITSPMMIALRDNPLAIREGDASAPKIYGQAIARLGNGLQTLAITAADTYSVGYGMGSTVGTLTTTSSSNVTAHTYTMTHYSGAARFRMSHSAGGGTSILDIFKGATLIATWSTTSGSQVQRTQDVTIAAGDVITWQHRNSGAGSGSTVFLGDLTASNAYVPQYPLIPATLV